MTLSDVAAQRTLTECADGSTERENTLTTDRALLDRTKQHVADVAAEHFPDLPIEAIDWTVSHRAQRTAGKTTYHPKTDEITITLSWNGFEQHG